MQTHNTKISVASHKVLGLLAAELGETRQAIIDKALESYRRQHFLEKCNKAFAALQADPRAREEELAEQKLWDATLADGLEED